MTNPQGNSKRPEQSEKNKPGQQPTEPGSKSEPREGQGGRPSEEQEYPRSGEKKNPGTIDDDEESDDRDAR